MHARFYRIVRWIIVILIATIAIVFLYQTVYKPYGPHVDSIDDRLPSVFHPSPAGFWTWVIGLGISSGFLFWWSIHLLRSANRAPVPAPEEKKPEGEPALSASWKEILGRLRLSSGAPVYFMTGASSDQAAAVLNAAGLSGDDPVPSDLRSAIKAFQTDEGLIVWCGTPAADTLVFASQAVQALSPGVPRLRGMMVLIPALELAGNQGPSLADAPRAALSAASRVLDTRHPVYVLITGMEDVPGFLEFVRRMPAGQRDVGRCGFAIPAGPQPIHKRDASAFARFLQWYDVNMLDLVADEPLNQEGNEGLVGLGRWFHDIHPSLLGILDALGDAGEQETVDLLGCYFTANGPVPERRAFTASTLRGRVVGDPHSARWAPETIATDRSHRRYAWIVAAVSACLLLPPWAYILLGIGSQEVVVAGWIILFATIAGWCITCYKILNPASSSTNA